MLKLNIPIESYFSLQQNCFIASNKLASATTQMLLAFYLEAVCYSFVLEKITFFIKIITFENIVSVCYSVLK
jgi:hypothetical protein